MASPLRKDQWFYDDSGYYSYVLLNGSQQEFAKVRKILEEAGIRVLLAGSSHRPARNNKQYAWYIRVASSDVATNSKPSQEQIAKVLSPEVTPSPQLVPVTVTVERSKELPKKQQRELRERNKQLETQLALARNQLRQITSEVEHLQAIQEQYKRLSLKWSSQLAELQTYRRENTDLSARLAGLEDKVQSLDGLERDHSKYEAMVLELREKLEKAEIEFSQWLAITDEEIERKNREIVDLQNELTMTCEEKDRLLERIHQLPPVETDTARNSNYELFRETVRTLMPQVEFMGGSFEVLWQEIPNPVRILHEINNLNELRGRRVQGAAAWFERHVGKIWRIYYRRSDQNDRQYVLISHKTSQTEDIEWLKRQLVN